MSGFAASSFDELDSTNAYLRRQIEARAVDGDACAVAARQTGGKGRFGRAWVSPLGGLWMSIATPPLSSPTPQSAPTTDAQSVMAGLALRLAMAVRASVLEQLPEAEESLLLKWPNDLVVVEAGSGRGRGRDAPRASWRKVGGVLVEHFSHDRRHWLVIGVGINANFAIEQLEPELRQSATTLSIAFGRTLDLVALREQLAERLLTAVRVSPPLPEVVKAFTAVMVGIDQPTVVTLPNGELLAGVLRGLAPETGLAEVEFENSRRQVVPAGAVIKDGSGL